MKFLIYIICIERNKQLTKGVIMKRNLLLLIVLVLLSSCTRNITMIDVDSCEYTLIAFEVPELPEEYSHLRYSVSVYHTGTVIHVENTNSLGRTQQKVLYANLPNKGIDIDIYIVDGMECVAYSTTTILPKKTGGSLQYIGQDLTQESLLKNNARYILNEF